jgi:c-di-GMP-binding flagellar brake protein YcgR
MEERRKSERNNPFYYLRVFDTGNRQFGGRVINLTPEGMTLKGEEAVRKDTFFKFRMTLPETIPDRKQMTISVKSIWCEEDKEPDYYRIGFCFENLSPRNYETICQLCQITIQQ